MNVPVFVNSLHATEHTRFDYIRVLHDRYSGMKVSNHPTQIKGEPQGQSLVIVNPVVAMIYILPSLLYTYKVNEVVVYNSNWYKVSLIVL